MGSWDCYCALCAGPLSIGSVRFGNRSYKAYQDLKRREAEAAKSAGSVRGGHREVDETINIDNDNKDPAFRLLYEPGYNAFAKKDEPSWGDDSASDSDFDPEEDSVTSSSDDESFISNPTSDVYSSDISDVALPPASPEPVELKDPDSWSECSELSIWENWNPYETYDGFDVAEYAYDREVLRPDDIMWIHRARCLGFNPEAPGISKAYITGRGSYDDYGTFEVKSPGNDKNDPKEECQTCFYAFSADQVVSFPFHEECYKVLAKALGYRRYRDIDKDVLYGVMTAFTDEYASTLQLDYGILDMGEQAWGCQIGEEYVVCDPRFRPEIEETLQGVLPASLFSSTHQLPEPSRKTQHDPWHVVPYDILLTILEEVETKDMLSLMTASMHVLEGTRDNAFWKYMLRKRVLPWFWELDAFLQSATLPVTFDYKGLVTWSCAVTTEKRGIHVPFQAVVNRRRIWTACTDLVLKYKEKARPILPEQFEDEEAKAILARAESSHMPVVMLPKPKEPTTIGTQFIHSWHEIAYRACELNTYWNVKNALIGIAVSFGPHHRVFGDASGILGIPFHIKAEEWIKEIRVTLSECNMFDENLDRTGWGTGTRTQPSKEVHICGMEIILTSGRSKIVYGGPRRSNQRPFVVLPDMYLIGLTGQIAPTGVISRLGFLQSRHPDSNNTPRPQTYPVPQTMLWHHSATHLPNLAGGPRPYQTLPIWQHPRYRLRFFPQTPMYMRSDEIPSSILPYHILLWAHSAAHLTQVTGLAALVVGNGETSSGNESWPTPDVVGFTAYTSSVVSALDATGKAGSIGAQAPLPVQHPEWEPKGCNPWGTTAGEKLLNPSDLDLKNSVPNANGPDFQKHFAIDGAGGERIIEVAVTEGSKVIKVVTNRGRQIIWGGLKPGHEPQWFSKKVEEREDGNRDGEEVILGLVVCFGSLGGWSYKAKMWSHWVASEVGVVLGRRDGGTWG